METSQQEGHMNRLTSLQRKERERLEAHFNVSQDQKRKEFIKKYAESAEGDGNRSTVALTVALTLSKARDFQSKGKSLDTFLATLDEDMHSIGRDVWKFEQRICQRELAFRCVLIQRESVQRSLLEQRLLHNK